MYPSSFQNNYLGISEFRQKMTKSYSRLLLPFTCKGQQKGSRKCELKTYPIANYCTMIPRERTSVRNCRGFEEAGLYFQQAFTVELGIDIRLLRSSIHRNFTNFGGDNPLLLWITGDLQVSKINDQDIA